MTTFYKLPESELLFIETNRVYKRTWQINIVATSYGFYGDLSELESERYFKVRTIS